MSRRTLAAAALFSALLGVVGVADATDLRVFTIPGIGSGTTGPIAVYFNPKEYTVTKSTPWKHHDIQGLDAPTLEFTSGEPYRVQFELFFDRYEEGKSVREITDKIEALAVPDPATGRPPKVLVTWGHFDWSTRLLEASTEILDVAADGTPLAAVMETLWSTFEEVGEPPPSPVLVPAALSTPDWKVPVSIDASTLELLTLQKRGGVRSQPVEMRPGACLAPRVAIVAGDPQRLRMDLVFDTSDTKSDVRTQTDLLARPPHVLLTWGTGCAFKCILESFSLRFTLFLDDGTPVRAVMNTVFKEFSPAEEQLKGNPRH